MSTQERSVVIVCFAKDASSDSIQDVVRALGVAEERDQVCRWYEPGLLCVRPRPAVGQGELERVKGMSSVRRVAMFAPGLRLYSPGNGAVPRDITLPGGAKIGPARLGVIAGPCSAESESQVRDIAVAVKEAGAVALRGGAFKPRTSPYDFGGLGERGLEFLALAREQTGLPVVTEALDTADVDLVARYADIIQIGSRNMHSSPLLFKVGSHASGKPVLLKRGLAATIEEFLEAAEYVLLGRLFAGIAEPNLILCERGIRSFETSTRFTLDVAAVPILKERTGLPVIVDPSHPAGERKYVAPLARAAVAAGADGLLIEVHTDPKSAWCDGAQTIDVDAFRALMDDLGRIRALDLGQVSRLPMDGGGGANQPKAPRTERAG